MLFSKEFDSSLWLILKSDKKYRKEIMDILNNIPQTMYDKIKKEIGKVNTYYKNTLYGLVSLENITEEYKSNNGYVYGFTLSYKVEPDLVLYKKKLENDKSKSIFRISLQELPEDCYMYVQNFIGCIDLENSQIMYDLINNKVFSRIVKEQDIYLEKNKEIEKMPRIKIVNAKKIPDVTIENINKKILRK